MTWSWIWNLKLPENIRHFVWIIMHGKLPTNCTRVTHHISTDKSCYRCGAANETILHTLRDCPKAMQVWNDFDFPSHTHFHGDDMYNWVKLNAVTDHGPLFLICCWMIWKSRNEESFKNISRALWNTLSQITTLLHSTKKAFGGSNKISTPILVSWHPPPKNVIKVNVDGSSIGNPGPSGFGGLLRNTFGGWITGFAGSCGFTSNINAELQAISHDLDIAWNHGFRNVICESDFQTALKLIQEGVPSTHPYAPLVDYIRSLIHKKWQLVLVHTLRKGNASVDWIAKLGASLVQELKMFPICPSPLSNICLADSMGIQFPRA
jgi:ribonuclease HI